MASGQQPNLLYQQGDEHNHVLINRAAAEMSDSFILPNLDPSTYVVVKKTRQHLFS